jgi:hypothetical protein
MRPPLASEPPAASPSADMLSQALQQLKGARDVALSLERQPRSEERLEDHQRWLEAVATLTLKASELVQYVDERSGADGIAGGQQYGALALISKSFCGRRSFRAFVRCLPHYRR